MGSCCNWWCLCQHLLLAYPHACRMQAQGCFVAVVLAAGWHLAARARRKQLLHQSTAAAAATGAGVGAGIGTVGNSPSPPLPGVTVVLPVKGCRVHSQSNWASHLSMQYDGSLEFMFVVESADDAAYGHVQSLVCDGPQRQVRLLTAGSSQACSQKIHNLIAGIQSSSAQHEYVLCLDDDVELHPHCLQQLVHVMQQDTSLFMATGYPFDMPPPSASLLAYCVLVYHLPLLIAFSVSERTNFVWGGCMLLRRQLLLPDDTHGVLQAWHDGGYSDDLLLAALCTERGLPIAVPSFALFPQWLKGQYSLPEYLNYLHRQLYVLDTYSNRHNRVLNHTMMVIHSWATASWAASMLMVLYKPVTWLLSWLDREVLHMDMASATAVHSWTLSHQENTVAFQNSSIDATSQQPHGWCSCSSWSMLLFVCCMAAAHISLLWMTGIVLKLLHSLDPRRNIRCWPWQQFSFVKLWAAFLVESCVLPCAVLYTLCCPYVTWSGVQYKKQHGKVVRVCGHAEPVQAPNQRCTALRGWLHKIRGVWAGLPPAKDA